MDDVKQQELEREKLLSEIQVIKDEEKSISRELSILLPQLKDVENKMKSAQVYIIK
jgi:predicted  nucleic acid-binding Zn-ribbon protein